MIIDDGTSVDYRDVANVSLMLHFSSPRDYSFSSTNSLDAIIVVNERIGWDRGF